ncbi:MAG TPA: N-(5'-phosphoribosyl)anthranilate isomerase [Acidimicrobiaceae bacterium]|nr:N-(5'-phosphoribosyl)anthranilate isomerase [Acidimicrobiaceae bacterium]HCB37392.1 N-(5'-phosphoribosyl)anthranilate isomerase [Acidimicrobiaceae bacterium]
MFVKVCGVTTEEDALLAVAMGADAVGFNFVAASPRRTLPGTVRDIVRRLPGGVFRVGVFQNEHPKRVVEIMDEAQLNTAQLHGNESPEECTWVSERVQRLFKAFRPGDPGLENLAAYRAAAILVDGAEPGSGKVFDWTRLDGVSRGLPLIVAGGLTPANVGDAIRTLRPFGVDVASGVEASPGVKDPTKVREFVANARAAALETGLEARPATGTASGTATGTNGEPAGRSRPYDWSDE